MDVKIPHAATEFYVLPSQRIDTTIVAYFSTRLKVIPDMEMVPGFLRAD